MRVDSPSPVGSTPDWVTRCSLYGLQGSASLNCTIKYRSSYVGGLRLFYSSLSLEYVLHIAKPTSRTSTGRGLPTVQVSGYAMFCSCKTASRAGKIYQSLLTVIVSRTKLTINFLLGIPSDHREPAPKTLQSSQRTASFASPGGFPMAASINPAIRRMRVTLNLGDRRGQAATA